MSQEKLLVLGISEPYRSKKHGAAVCVAGVTYHGEFRRIYSIPLRYYHRHPFKKYQYVSYDVIGKGGDGRPESRKIEPRSIKVHNSLGSNTIEKKIDDKKSKSLHYLQERSRITLGIIKPKFISKDIFSLEDRNYHRTIKYSTPRSGNKSINVMPFWIKFKFRCEKKGCSGHNILCEDIEIGNYYRRLLKRMNRREAKSKVEKRVRLFLRERRPYFLMGTHRRYKDRWLIISFLTLDASHFYAYRKGVQG